MYSDDWYHIRRFTWGRMFLWIYLTHCREVGNHVLSINLWGDYRKSTDGYSIGNTIIHFQGLLPVQVEILHPPAWLLELLRAPV
jgi:hypothetical protein